jgi:hypothetical protein
VIVLNNVCILCDICRSLSTRSEPSIISQHSVASAASQIRKVQHIKEYKVDPKNVGICMIINQKNFYQDSNPEYKVSISFSQKLII